MSNNMVIVSSGPVYEHDCDECTYVATVFGNHHPIDLYVHHKATFTVIARHSDEPSDYQSGAVFGRVFKQNNNLRLAGELAMYQGLIPASVWHYEVNKSVY